MKTVRIIRNWAWPDLPRQTPGGTGVWDGVQYTEAENAPCDYYLVLNNLAAGQPLSVSPDRVFRVVQEPPTEFFKPWHEHAPYASKTFMCDADRTGDAYIQSHPMVPWHINRDYDFLSSAAMPRKTGDISWITSTKTILAGHKKRMAFLDNISGKIPGLDVLGTEVHHIVNPAARRQNADRQKELGFEIVEDKWAGLAPYRYSLAIENFCGPDYWTEKIADCFLAWTLPIYYGCTNLEAYFPAESFIRIDIDKPNEAREIIRQAINIDSNSNSNSNGDAWQKRLSAITKARELVLNKYQLFPSITRYIKTVAENQNAKKSITVNEGCIPRISVIVCTYNREEMLPQCLQSLADQTLDKNTYEILVVDNNSSDNTKNAAAEFIKDHPNCTYLFEPQQGLSRARNLGWREARGEYIAFIDDDSTADTQWLAEALKIIDEKNPDIFGGAVFPIFPGGKPGWFKEQYGIRGDMGESGWLEKGFIIGTNIFFRKSLLLEYGGFDPRLGMNGDNLGYHEETQLVYRAFKEKRKVYFSKELIVNDILPDFKKSFIFFIYSKYCAGFDGFGLWPQDGHDWDIRKLLQLIKKTMAEFNTALLKRDKTKYPYPENYLLENGVLNNFLTIGLMAEFFLREEQAGKIQSVWDEGPLSTEDKKKLKTPGCL